LWTDGDRFYVQNSGDGAFNITRRAGPSASHEAAASRVHPADLRVKSNFLNRIRLFLPVQSRSKKYSGFPKLQISLYPRPSTPLEGRIAIVTDAGLDAMDAAALLTNGANADGEVVWS